MRSFFAVAVALAVGFGLFAGVAPVAGQEAAGNATATPTLPNASQGEDITSHEFEQAVDAHVTVKSWSYNTSTNRFTINLHVEQTSAIYISEVVSLESGGSQSINVYRGGLQTGDHEITFQAEPGPNGEAAAIISTSRSQRQGEAVIISTGQVADDLPLSQTRPTTAWLGGGAIVIAMVVLAGVQRIRNKQSAPEELEP